tara:strand:+ start:209 stop:520 length:312 start_codon:yes stop_codon:yes gene_type:complete
LQGKKSLTEKKSENEMVMAELNILAEDSGATVYKLVGPVLAKQDLGDAKEGVKARLDYMTKEIDRMSNLETEFLGKVEDKKKQNGTLQSQFRAEAQKMQASAQ